MEQHRLNWKKSSYSGGQSDCVEAATAGQVRLVRDSKAPAAGRLAFGTQAWSGLLDHAFSLRTG